jgi:hypothetical protein
VILKALSKRPEDRYPTAGEMGRALQAALAEAPTVNASVPPPAVASSAISTLRAQPKRLNPSWVISLIGVIAVVIGGGLFVMFGRGRDDHRSHISAE